jgi:heat shock protein HspQ
MKYETLEHIGRATADLADLFRESETVGPISTSADELVDDLVGISIIEEAVEAFLERVKRAKDAVSRTAIERFLELGQTSVSRRGKTVYLAQEYWPGPSIRDLLPPDASESDPNYAMTVAKCREAAKDRLLRTLKNSAEFSYLVVENYNAQSLRSALTGKDAQRDESDRPVLPPELEGIVDLNPQTKIRIRKSGK